MYKSDLRKSFLEKRSNLTRTEYWSLTEKLMEQVIQLQWDDYKLIHIFMPISRHKEIDTFSIIQYFKEKHPQLEIVIPRTDFKSRTLQNILYDHDYTILCRNIFDIPEPIHGKIIEPEKIDAVFVPLLAFDKHGHRVGYGKGFYDRFLGNCRSDVRKIGLSYFDPVEKITDVNAFDIKIDMCICPHKTWVFNSKSDGSGL